MLPLGSFLGLNVTQWLLILLIGAIVFLATSARRGRGRCPKCRRINRQGAKFCAQCGARLSDS